MMDDDLFSHTKPIPAKTGAWTFNKSHMNNYENIIMNLKMFLLDCAIAEDCLRSDRRLHTYSSILTMVWLKLM